MRTLRIKIPAALAELAGETTIWPVWVATPRSGGYTYYGGAFADGSDRFLATRENIMMFSEPDALWQKERLSGSSFVGHDGFQRLLREVTATAAAADYTNGEWMPGFDFNAALMAVRRGDAHTAPHAGDTLDCLNALRDVAKQFPVIHEFPIRDAALETLYDAIWEIAPANSVDYEACDVALTRCVSILDDLVVRL